jgi:elongation factor Tu
MSALLTIAAKIYLLSPEEEGRQTPIFSGYRPALYFGERQTDGAITLTAGDRAAPGTECVVMIALLHPEHLGDALKPLAPFVAKEGSRVVGRGQVLCIPYAAAKP